VYSVPGKGEPVRELALAVLRHAVADARSGGCHEKADVRWCLEFGALPFWVDVVADSQEGVDAITRELENLVRL
jgi:hypothetical protein